MKSLLKLVILPPLILIRNKSKKFILSTHKDIKYYTYNVTIDGNKLVSTVHINYAKIDTKKLIEIDSANSQLINDGKVKLSSVKSLYEPLGAHLEMSFLSCKGKLILLIEYKIILEKEQNRKQVLSSPTSR